VLVRLLQHGGGIAAALKLDLRLVAVMEKPRPFVEEPASLFVDADGNDLVFSFVHRLNDVPGRNHRDLMFGGFSAEKNGHPQFLFHRWRG